MDAGDGDCYMFYYVCVSYRPRQLNPILPKVKTHCGERLGRGCTQIRMIERLVDCQPRIGVEIE